MNRLLFYISFLFIHVVTAMPFQNKYAARKDKFHLRLEVVGYGSNRFRMQPVLDVDQDKIVLTMECVWKFQDSPDTPNDTLLIGQFRQSSIDSISALISHIKDTVVYKIDPTYISGSAVHLTIKNEQQSLKFHLHNAEDSISNKILAILNSYSAEARNNYIE